VFFSNALHYQMSTSKFKTVSQFYNTYNKGIIQNIRQSVDTIIKKLGICGIDVPASTVLGLMHDTPLNPFGSDGPMFNPDKIQFIDVQFVPRSRVEL
jgi:hypothetical protein